MAMSLSAIELEFKEKVSGSVRLSSEGMERYRVFTPFVFEDGDHLSIVLKKKDGGWLLTDEAHTLMHLTYEIDEKDLQSGTRQRIIENALSVFQIEDRAGELVLPVEGGEFGNALYSFIQALVRISDVSYLTRERVRSTFEEDFRWLIAETVPDARRAFDWHDPSRDPAGIYNVDCRINGMPRPLFVYALPSDGRTRDATISLLQFEKWQIPFQSLAVFEDQEAINRKVLARFTDVAGTQFSNLVTNRERIVDFVKGALEA